METTRPLLFSTLNERRQLSRPEVSKLNRCRKHFLVLVITSNGSRRSEVPGGFQQRLLVNYCRQPPPRALYNCTRL